MSYSKIIDPITGEVLPEGEEGELVFTSLSKEAPQSGGAGDISGGDISGGVEASFVDANEIFKNHWSTEEFKEAMYNLPQYVNYKHHTDYKNRLDEMIESGVSLTYNENDYKDFYLRMIKYLVKKCGGEMSVWEDVSGEKIQLPIQLIGSDDATEIAQLKEILNDKLENIYLSREPRQTHSGAFPWSNFINKLENFKESLDKDLSAEWTDPFLPEKKELETYIYDLGKYIKQVRNKAANISSEIKDTEVITDNLDTK